MTGFTAQKMPFRLIIFAIGFIAALVIISLSMTMMSRAPDTTPEAGLPDKIFNAETYTLENGLEIIVVPNHRVPVVTHMLWYKVGAADEERGLSGIAHFLEHLMFKGSTGLAAGEFSKTVRGLGGNDNAFTSQDYTAYFQSIAKEHLQTVMRMEAGRMRGMNPPQDHVLSERNVIIEERKQRTDNSPASRLTEQMRSLAFINHPYSIPVIGWMHEIEELEWPDIKEFYDRYYGPNNAVLIVTGDVTGEEVYAIAKKTYGTLPMVDVPERARTDIPPMIANPTLSVADPLVYQPSMKLLFRVPSLAQDQETALALQVLEEIMGAGAPSRLYQSLVVKQKLASNISLSYSSASLGPAELWIAAYPSDGVDMATLYNAIKAELNTLITEGITETELTAAKQRLQDSSLFALDSLSGPAMIIGREYLSGTPIETIETWPHLIGAVTAQQVQQAAKTYLNIDDRKSKTFYVRGDLLPETVTQEMNEPAETQETNL